MLGGPKVESAGGVKRRRGIKDAADSIGDNMISAGASDDTEVIRL